MPLSGFPLLLKRSLFRRNPQKVTIVAEHGKILARSDRPELSPSCGEFSGVNVLTVTPELRALGSIGAFTDPNIFDVLKFDTRN